MPLSPLLLLLPILGLTPDLSRPAVVAPISSLTREPESPIEHPPVRYTVDSLIVKVRPGEESRISLELDLRGLEKGWGDIRIVGGELALSHATLDGASIALPTREDGWRYLDTRFDGAGVHRLRVEGTVLSASKDLKLKLARSSRTRVLFEDPSLEAEIEQAVSEDSHSFDLPPTELLSLSWHPPRPPIQRPVSISAESITALSVDEAGATGSALLDYRVANGKVDRLGFRLPGGAQELEVSGPAVASFSQQGEQVEVRLHQPTEGQVAMELKWRSPAPLGENAMEAPVVVPTGVWELKGYVTLARTEESNLMPELHGGLEPVSSRALPVKAIGLVPGTTQATWRISGKEPDLRYRMLRSSLVETPPTLVDEARYSVALTDHGNMLFKATYQVRNDRRQYLRVEPPSGLRCLGVRVAGRVVQPVADQRGGLLIPLEKSIESMTGLVSFPVDLYLMGRQQAWEKKGRTELLSPAVDAPVAYARWEILLPPGYQAAFLDGTASLVKDWSGREGGLSYGRSYGEALVNEQGEKNDRTGRLDLASASSVEQDRREELAQEFFNQAYQAYKGNRFSDAQRLIDEALGNDPAHAASQSLNQNLAVLGGKDTSKKEKGKAESRSKSGDSGGADEAQARRVKDLARARSTNVVLESTKVMEKAEEATRAGDLEAAEDAWNQVFALNRELAQVEQKESHEAEEAQKRAGQELERIQQTRNERQVASKKSSPKKAAEQRPSPRSSAVASGSSQASFYGGGDSKPGHSIPTPDDYRADDGLQGIIVAGDDSEEEALGWLEESGGELMILGTRGEGQPVTQVFDVAGGITGELYGSGGLGVRGTGSGGGGSAEGIGGLATGYGSGKGRTEIDFEDISISGELVRPQAALTVDGKNVTDGPSSTFRSELLDQFKETLDSDKDSIMDSFDEVGLDYSETAPNAPEPVPVLVEKAIQLPGASPEPMMDYPAEPAPARIASESRSSRRISAGDLLKAITPDRAASRKPEAPQAMDSEDDWDGEQESRAEEKKGKAKAAAAPPPPKPVTRTTTVTTAIPLAQQAPKSAPRPSKKGENQPQQPKKARTTITASRLIINLPEAGARMRFEQRLVPADQPLRVEIRYHARKKP